MYVCGPVMYLVPIEVKRAVYTLKLYVQTVVSQHISTGNQTVLSLKAVGTLNL